MVIGKGGEKLKAVRSTYSVEAQVQREPVYHAATCVEERALTLTGPASQLAQALTILLRSNKGQGAAVPAPWPLLDLSRIVSAWASCEAGPVSVSALSSTQVAAWYTGSRCTWASTLYVDLTALSFSPPLPMTM